MWLDIIGRGMPVDASARERVERRLNFALGRFGERIGRVTVCLADDNGPRGGIDKRCQVMAQIVGRKPAVLEVRDSDLNTLIDRAADRLGQAVRRSLERARMSAQ